MIPSFLYDEDAESSGNEEAASDVLDSDEEEEDTSSGTTNEAVYDGKKLLYKCQKREDISHVKIVRGGGGDASDSLVIVPGALGQLPNLVSITFPKESFAGGLIISECAFASCPKLKKVALPDGLRLIGPSAFTRCSALETVTFAEKAPPPSSSYRGPLTIGPRAFEECTSLTKICLPFRTALIPSHCFKGCSGLRTVTFSPVGSSLYPVTKISDDAFRGCNKSLSTIVIPKSAFLSPTGGSWRMYVDGKEEGGRFEEEGDDDDCR